MAQIHNRILKPFLILCEGKDVENFMINYLESDALAYDSRFSNDIQTFDFKGINDLKAFIGTLVRMDGFDLVCQILVLRDAETDVDKAITNIQNAFRVNDLLVPERPHTWKKESDSDKPATAFTLLPKCDPEPTTGALEDLCWNILKDKHANQMRNDVLGFINDIKNNYGTISTHEHKSRLHTYFSVNEKYISLKIGEAAKVGAFAWDHEKLDGLKNIMLEGLDMLNRARFRNNK